MTRKHAFWGAELAGFVLIALGAFVVETWVGLVVTGLMVVLAAALLDVAWS